MSSPAWRCYRSDPNRLQMNSPRFLLVNHRNGEESRIARVAPVKLSFMHKRVGHAVGGTLEKQALPVADAPSAVRRHRAAGRPGLALVLKTRTSLPGLTPAYFHRPHIATAEIHCASDIEVNGATTVAPLGSGGPSECAVPTIVRNHGVHSHVSISFALNLFFSGTQTSKRNVISAVISLPQARVPSPHNFHLANNTVGEV